MTETACPELYMSGLSNDEGINLLGITQTLV